VADDLKIKVNGQISPVAASADTPLLYVLTNELKLWGPRFGCGLAQCGSCSVLADGVEIRSCVTPVGAVAGKSLTTFEGLAAWYAQQKGLAQAPALHPNRSLITGVVCGVRVESVEDPLMQKIRYLDKLVDELAKGKAMEKVLRA